MTEASLRAAGPPAALRRFQTGRQQLGVLVHDMSAERLDAALRVCLECFAFEDFAGGGPLCRQLSGLARAISAQLDKELPQEGAWQVLVGNAYGSFFTHTQGTCATFRYADLIFTVFVSP